VDVHFEVTPPQSACVHLSMTPLVDQGSPSPGNRRSADRKGLEERAESGIIDLVEHDKLRGGPHIEYEN